MDGFKVAGVLKGLQGLTEWKTLRNLLIKLNSIKHGVQWP